MTSISRWLESCFDPKDRRAPLRALLLGGVSFSIITMVLSFLLPGPIDLRFLAIMLVCSLYGGGCLAMWALPREERRHLLLLSVEMTCLLPLAMLFGVGLPGLLIICAFVLGIFFVLVSLRVIAGIVLCPLLFRRQLNDKLEPEDETTSQPH